MQSAYHSHKLKPYRQLARTERTTAKAEINYLYKKSLRDNPEAASNPLSKWQQKRAIKKQYATARFSGSANTAASASSTAKNTKTAAKTTAKATDKVVQFITKNKKADLSHGYRNRSGETLFIDARELGTMISRTTKELTVEDIARIADTYHAWRSTPEELVDRIQRGDSKLEKYDDIAGFCGISSRSSVNRMLKELRTDGVITVKNHKFIIQDVSYLLDQIAN